MIRCKIPSSSRDAGMRHTASCCLAFHCFERKMSPHKEHRAGQLLGYWCTISSLMQSKLSQFTMRHVYSPAQTTEWNMNRWCRTVMSNIWWINDIIIGSDTNTVSDRPHLWEGSLYPVYSTMQINHKLYTKSFETESSVILLVLAALETSEHVPLGQSNSRSPQLSGT